MYLYTAYSIYRSYLSFVKNDSDTGQVEQIKIKLAHFSYFGTRSFLVATHCIHIYSKCSKILNTFLFSFSNKILLFMAGIKKMLDSIANREDPDQTASEEAV